MHSFLNVSIQNLWKLLNSSKVLGFFSTAFFKQMCAMNGGQHDRFNYLRDLHILESVPLELVLSNHVHTNFISFQMYVKSSS